MLWFHCDESYDSQFNDPTVFVVGGAVADDTIWRRVEDGFSAANLSAGVTEYHAADVNAFGGEFEKWKGTPEGKDCQIAYGKQLIKTMQDQGRRLHVVSVGMLKKEYERIIDESGRRKFGHPYIVCFKECIALLAEEMERHWEPEHRFSVIFDRDRENKALQQEATEVFYQMKDGEGWPPRHRLGTCTPGDSNEIIALQSADLVAYETFRLIHDKHFTGGKVRKAFDSLFPHNGFSGLYYDAGVLERIKGPLDAANVVPNGFVVIHSPEYTREGSDEIE
jgi:hypothetical protein